MLATSLYVTLIVSKPAQALDSACNTQDNILSVAVTLPEDTYDIYVKLARSGQNANAQLAITDAKTGCKPIGSVVASGNEWVKISDTVAINNSVQFNLQLSTIENSYEYDRPTVMAVSHSSPTCVPRDECYVDIQGQAAKLRPSNSSSDTGTLRFFHAKSIERQAISEVEYYVDGQYMYKTTQLEDFDPQAIPYYGRTTSRLIKFENGQTAVIEESVPSSHFDSPGAMLARSFNKYHQFLLWIGIIVGIFIFYHVSKHIIIAVENRRYWLHAHGFIKDPPLEPMTPSRLSHIYTIDKIRRIISGLGVFAIIGVACVVTILILDSYVVRIASVSGNSMERTLRNGEKVIINKLGVTFSQINQSDFVPQRGQVVAAHLISRFDEQQDVSDDNIMIKRVIGLPGERVVIRGSSVTIFNTQSPNGFDPSKDTAWSQGVISDMGDKVLDITLGYDEIFVLGDNRPGSIDSRANGPVSLKYIIGVIHR